MTTGDEIPRSLGEHWRDLELSDTARLSELFEESFDQRRTHEDWVWRYFDAPGRVDTFVYDPDGQAMAFMGQLWFDAWVEGQHAVLLRGGDFMADPIIRGTGYSDNTMGALKRIRTGAQVGYGFPAEVSYKVMNRLKSPMPRSGVLPQWVRWQTGGAVHADAPRVPSVAGALLALALRGRAALRSGRSGRRGLVDVDEASFDEWAPAFDELAERSKDFVSAILVRNAAYVHWRWIRHPGPAWRVLVAPSKGSRSIDGYVAFAVRDGQGRIADLLASDQPTMLALVRAATRQLGHEGAERIMIELHDPREWAAQVLRRCGFLARGTGPVVSVGRYTRELPESVNELSSWYLTLADTDHI